MVAGVGGLGLACLHIARRIKAKPDLDILKLGHLAAGMAARRFFFSFLFLVRLFIMRGKLFTELNKN